MAIGCPYGGDDQHGLVLIYNGHGGGLMDTPTQTLSGHWASSSFPASFGFALRGNRDLDKNGYPGTANMSTSIHVFNEMYVTHLCHVLFVFADLIVGAFGVDKAVLYRYVGAHKLTFEKLKTLVLWLFLLFHGVFLQSGPGL